MDNLHQLKAANDQKIKELNISGDKVLLERSIEFRDYINYRMYKLTGEFTGSQQTLFNEPADKYTEYVKFTR